MPVKIIREVIVSLVLVCVATTGYPHGPTLCVGTIHYSEGDTVSLDLRFGVGLLHKYVDPDDNAVISQEEWTSSTESLEKLFGSGIRLAWNDKSTTPSEIRLNLTSGSEIQVLATLDAPSTAPGVAVALPVLRKLPAAPPAQVSVWYNKTMVRDPELLWFDGELLLDRTRRSRLMK